MGRPSYGGRNDSRSPPRYRSRSRGKGGGGKGGKGGGGKGGKGGRHKVTVENLPNDMSWQELKDLVVEIGPSLTFARTFEYRGVPCGMVEFERRHDAEAVFGELDDR